MRVNDPGRVQTFDEICGRYAAYIRNIGSDVTVAFDGYENDSENTKHAEQLRRIGCTTSCRDYMFNCTTPVPPVSQEVFLSNKTNKMKLIKMLATYLSPEFNVRIAIGDADPIIVNTAFELCRTSEKTVVVVGEDTDLAVLLAGLGNVSTRKRTFFRKSMRKGPPKMYLLRSIIEGVFFEICPRTARDNRM